MLSLLAQKFNETIEIIESSKYIIYVNFLLNSLTMHCQSNENVSFLIYF